MTLEAGDLILVPFPYTDLSSKKTRPALVLSDRRFNDGPDAIVCAVTSNLQNAERSVIIGQDDMASGTLRAPSRIKPAKLVTLQQSIIRKRVGAVSADVMRHVWKELDNVLGR